MAAPGMYSYSALPDSKTHIRLLVLSPQTEEMSASLEIHPISSAPPYEAVSYAWGTEAPSSLLQCNSSSVALTPHLLEGIRQIRETIKSARLWIDAICINQPDNDEKAGQIPLMTQIYSRATRVLVWLGAEAVGSGRAMDELGPITEKLMTVATDTTDISLVEGHRKMGIPSLFDPVWFAMGELWSRSWFRRLWVLQEAILAKDVLFICGNRVSDLEMLSLHWSHMYRTGLAVWTRKRSRLPEDVYHSSSTITLLKQLRLKGSFIHTSLIQRGRNFEVSEPLDRIYGLLGLMDDRIRQNIVIDYSTLSRKEHWNLYLSFGKLMVEEEGLYILSIAGSTTRPLGLPSWVPNCNNPKLTSELPMNQYQAGGGIRSIHRNIEFSGSASIRIAGLSLGVIAATSRLGDFKRRD